MDRPFCRLTVLAPRHRVDVALPSDVPVAELVPMVLELVGEPGRAVAPRPWRLSGIVGGPLPAAATLGELGVLDGELLRLGPALPVPAAPVFDDPVDAVAAGAATGTRRYRFEAAVVLAVSVAAAVLLGVGGAGSVPSALLAGVGAVVAVVGAGRLAQRGGDPAFTQALARGVGLAGVALAAAAGWAAVPDPPGPVPLMAAAVAAGIAAAAAQLLLRVVAPTLVAAGAVAVVCAAAVIVVPAGRHAGRGGDRGGGAGAGRRAPPAPRRDPARGPAPTGRARRRERADRRRRPAAAPGRARRTRRPRPRVPRRAGRRGSGARRGRGTGRRVRERMGGAGVRRGHRDGAPAAGPRLRRRRPRPHRAGGRHRRCDRPRRRRRGAGLAAGSGCLRCAARGGGGGCRRARRRGARDATRAVPCLAAHGRPWWKGCSSPQPCRWRWRRWTCSRWCGDGDSAA